MSSFPESPRRRGAAGDAGVWLLALALALLVLTALDPRWPLPRVVHRHLLVLDITQSMNVADAGDEAVPRTRLEQAKLASVQALAALDCGSQIGVGLFTGHRTLMLFTPVEVCAHYGEIVSVLRAVDWRMAWEFRSEVAKGLYSALDVALAMEEPATVVFLSDGHEAPPLNPRYPPRYKHEPGAVRGVVVGVGGTAPARIPRLGPDGRQRGWFGADEVLQIDPYTLGRAGSSEGEAMAGNEAPVSAFTGTEHLSALRENHLRALASRLELGYARMASPDTLAEVLTTPSLGRRETRQMDLRWLLGLLALAGVTLTYLPRRGRRQPAAAGADRPRPAASVRAAGRRETLRPAASSRR